MIDASQLRNLISDIIDGLEHYSHSAADLLMGTAAQESVLGTFLRQLGRGPALGIMQMEPATEQDIWENYLDHRPALTKLVQEVCGRSGPGPWLCYDLAYQIAMARIHYLRVPEALPMAGDVNGLARYWKQYYNTPAGAGHVEEFVENYQLVRY